MREIKDKYEKDIKRIRANLKLTQMELEEERRGYQAHEQLTQQIF